MQTPCVIAGLGNPGSRYAWTRHNAGFLVLDRVSKRWGGGWETNSRFRSELARVNRAGRTVWLCRPQTFMNLSGEAVGGVAQFYRVPADQVLVVVDDADLPLGALRLRSGGSSAGHHGLDSIEQQLGTRTYPRQRLGIGRTVEGRSELAGHVLARFTRAEREMFERVLERAADQLECWLSEGVRAAMNRYNGQVLNAET
jgi:PTH1 family peptidyl-tRNA hydrolase